MWTYNVLRELVRSDGVEPLPLIVPQEDREMEQLGRNAIAAGQGLHVLKVHSFLAQDLPNSLFVVTHRDLRDAMISFMRFTKADFAAGLRFIAGALRLERHYAGFPAERRLDIQYLDIITRPEVVATELAVRLGVDASLQAIRGILDGFSKEKVQERIAAREQALRDRIAAHQPVDRRDFVPINNTQLRAFDTETGFQSGHVSSYREGDWRHILTTHQQAEIEALIATTRAGQN